MENESLPTENIKSSKDQPERVDSYSANPNQIVYDLIHQFDFDINVADAYFAKKVNAPNKPNEYTYLKLNQARLGDKIYLVVKCYGKPPKGSLVISIRELEKKGNEQNLYPQKSISFLVNGVEKTELQFTIDEKIEYIQEIEIRPKDDKVYQELQDKLNGLENKSTHLTIRTEIKDTNATKINFKGILKGEFDAVKGARYYDFLNEEKNLFELKPKLPLIIIDAGHGYEKGSTGAVSYIYTYKSKNNKTSTSNVEDLPQYVIDDLSLIISTKEDPDRNEKFLVYDVSIKLKKLLEELGYSVLLTREERSLSGNDDENTRKKRIDLANDNKADYFISIHADGVAGYKASGSHVIYPNVGNDEVIRLSKELAVDIFSSYDIVEVEKNSPKQDIRGLQVLGKSNKTKRKVLIELGFVTSPKDAKLLFTKIDEISVQIRDGLLKNLKKF